MTRQTLRHFALALSLSGLALIPSISLGQAGLASKLPGRSPAFAAEREAMKPPTYTVLYTFTGGADGAVPYGARLIRDRAGNIYGTTNSGGNDSDCSAGDPPGCGVVFKLDGAGTETALYTFGGGTDGALPFAGLVRDAKGNLYGTTSGGGSGILPAGTVFKLDNTGNETVLYTFCPNGNCVDGISPNAVIRDKEGNLYGTTTFGGGANSGVVFKLDPTGAETVLYSFAGGADGANPFGSLIRDEAGNLYGTTTAGGPSGQGTVFKVDPSGSETVLYSFTGGTDGGFPEAGLVRDEKGNFYGATFFGGLASPPCYSFCGVVFKVDTTGVETVLYSFTGGADGLNPAADLMLGKSGNLYGTTAYGGDSDQSCATGIGCGVVFKLTR